ncbi:AtpZ/AtpI family protein [Swingsia samuiensis]|uniref:AtpZ/AtpI family protein n=1 Tax=Swingsia samuiensis TaxID=1293412 RepID=A0A4Y6UJY0_9PROT|nr:AtpZ/AtpI family protein [Swingsia samuiensis]QDH16948.1 AtpZ/AtpI family protein [Swingsia samuiensis]
MEQNSSGDGHNFDKRLQAADHKLNPRLKKSSAESSDDGTTTSSFGIALRVGTELIAGLAVGVLIGYFLDRWLGYRALFLIIFALLGCSAGMLNVWRVVNGPGMMSAPKEDGRSQRGSRIND